MRKATLNMDQNARYEIIKKLVDTNGNKQRASIQIVCYDQDHKSNDCWI